jgi:hypothetical protein
MDLEIETYRKYFPAGWVNTSPRSRIYDANSESGWLLPFADRTSVTSWALKAAARYWLKRHGEEEETTAQFVLRDVLSRMARETLSQARSLVRK